MSIVTKESTPGLKTRSDGEPSVVEEYYALVNWLRQVGMPHGPKTVGLTSCAAQAGVSTVALNLAVAAAEICTEPVLLLDLSTTRAAAAARFSISGDLGLRDALSGRIPPCDCIKPSEVPNLSLLAANESDSAAALNVDFRRVNDILRALEREFQFIVVDLPTTDSSLCFVTVGLLSSVLLVMEAECTSVDVAARAKQRLMHGHANVAGVILNKNRQRIPAWLDSRL